MARYDVFNGDADGLCALQQLRLAEPVDARLVTGPKRDVALLARVAAGPGDLVTVLDVAMAVNGPALRALLERGAEVIYFDHHASGEVPVHPRLHAHLDPGPAVCTSLLVDRWLAGAHRRWALVGAYGDGLVDEATSLASALDLDGPQRRALHDLGTDLNYNAYGEHESDLIALPAALHALLRGHPDPLALDDDGTLARIRATRLADFTLACEHPTFPVGAHAIACVLPDAAWSRRVRGVLAHDLVRRAPDRGVAVLSADGHGAYVVSVRAPLAHRHGADVLCRQFTSGEGRAGAAGIDRLPEAQLDAFLSALAGAFPPNGNAESC